MAQSPGPIIFQRRMEPNEGALSLLVPEGWQLEGGILRANLMAQQVSAQSIEAKLDLNDQYLTMTNQEEYVNPYTREVDVGSNQWPYRWVTEGGNEFYTNDQSEDPNHNSALNRADWKRSEVRPRFPG